MYDPKIHYAEDDKKCVLLQRYDNDEEKFLDAATQGGGDYVDFSRRGEHSETCAHVQAGAAEEIRVTRKRTQRSRGTKRRRGKGKGKAKRRSKRRKM